MAYPRTQQGSQGAVKHRSCNQGCRKSEAFAISATLPLPPERGSGLILRFQFALSHFFVVLSPILHWGI